MSAALTHSPKNATNIMNMHRFIIFISITGFTSGYILALRL